MAKIIDVPGQGQVEFPDSMDDAQIVAAIQKMGAPAAPNNGMMATNSANKAIAGIPDAVLNTPNRIMNLGKAAFGTAATAFGRPDLAPEMTPDPDFIRKAFDKIGATKDSLEPATTGQRIADSLIQGAVGGVVSPANGMRQAMTNMALGAAGGGAAGVTREATGNDALAMTAGMLAPSMGAKAIGSAKNKLAATALRQQQNAVRDQNLGAAREAGYVFSPSESSPGMLNQTLEGIAGKLSTRQLASQRNQDVTNTGVRKDLGIPDNVPITPDLLKQLRADAYQAGYKPVEAAGTVRPGAAYRRALDDIESNYKSAANSFPDAVKNDVAGVIEPLRVKQFDAGDALKMTQLLRDESGKSYANGDKGLGKAQRAAAGAIEDQIERALVGQGENGAAALQGFRDARKLMATTHTVDKALSPGTGNVSAQKLASQLRKGVPLEGDMRTAALAADAFPKNMQSPETMGAVPGISPLDVFGGASLGAMGTMATGNPAGAMLAAAPAARPAIRQMLLSDAYQNSMGKPKYKNSALARALANGDVQNPQANAAMIAAILAGQQ